MKKATLGIVGLLVIAVAIPPIRQVLDKRKVLSEFQVGQELTTALYTHSATAGFPAILLSESRSAQLCEAESWQRIDLTELRPSLLERSLLRRARRHDVHLELRCDPAGVALELADGDARWEDGYYVRRPQGLGP